MRLLREREPAPDAMRPEAIGTAKYETKSRLHAGDRANARCLVRRPSGYGATRSSLEVHHQRTRVSCTSSAARPLVPRSCCTPQSRHRRGEAGRFCGRERYGQDDADALGEPPGSRPPAHADRLRAPGQEVSPGPDPERLEKMPLVHDARHHLRSTILVAVDRRVESFMA